MSTQKVKSHDECLDELKGNKLLLTAALKELRKKRKGGYTPIRLTKSEKDSFLKVWELAAEKTGFSDFSELIANVPKVIVVRKILGSKTKCSKDVNIHFNGIRKEIISELKNSGLVIKNENADEDEAIIVELVKPDF